MSNPRRRGGRSSDFGRRDQHWGSPRSGSPGSPGINGSPRTGRRDQRDRRSELLPTDHDSYVDYLKKRWNSVKSQMNATYYKVPDHNPAVEAVQPNFDVDRFFDERQQQQRQGQQSPPSNPQSHNLQGLPS
ncbi:uncharacterized protein LOC116296278 [Actinia tenebrosa]|uniref:Uncharacterized protein LOC116296278 n=1 Tax=Actinia tenebrosa TaxID=6105 RepID=A0A6P8I5Y9_ACTTE|nr:uncharacterized protein LOC116296278 [Actinia tenebrosa]